MHVAQNYQMLNKLCDKKKYVTEPLENINKSSVSQINMPSHATHIHMYMFISYFVHTHFLLFVIFFFIAVLSTLFALS